MNAGVQMHKKSCSPHLKTIFIDCELFYSQREFILVGVYIPHQVCVSEVVQHLADQKTALDERSGTEKSSFPHVINVIECF